jgi:hypothetical protein
MRAEIVDQMTRWLIAAGLAAVALFGAFALIAALVFVLEVPSWVEVVGGVVLALGTAGFAWLVASALESSRRHRPAGGDGPRRT